MTTVRSLRPLRVLLLGVALVALVGLVRPENLPNSAGFGSSSAQQRLILGTAGVDVFLHHPFLGVGWQRSTDPTVLGSEQLTAELRLQFPGVRDDFFPEATSTTTTTASVHNSYIQVLAESGLAGGLAMVFAAAVCATRLRALRRKLTGTEAQLARSMLIVLGVTLIWLNDNALFGAQPESVLLAFALGLLASFRAPVDDSEVRPATATART